MESVLSPLEAVAFVPPVSLDFQVVFRDRKGSASAALDVRNAPASDVEGQPFLLAQAELEQQPQKGGEVKLHV